MDTLFDRLKLWRTEGIGPISYYKLIKRYGSARQVIEAWPDLMAKAGGKAPSLIGNERITAELEYAKAHNIQYLCYDAAAYPAGLRMMADAPPVIMLHGRMDLLSKEMIAIVGARNASDNARKLTHILARDLADAGYIIVSGLARGVDTKAHLGAGAARTIAVIAGGADSRYPAHNAKLQEAISCEGLVVTERAPYTPPAAHLFPQRNRIIAGLSLATVVVEAAPRSGTLITARLANEVGREVFAVPGFPLDPRSQGCNALIRDGAQLIENAEQVIEALHEMRPVLYQEDTATPIQSAATDIADMKIKPDRRKKAYPPPSHDRKDLPDTRCDREKNIKKGLGGAKRGETDHFISLIGAYPTNIDDLIRQSNMDASQAQRLLLRLELSGKIMRHPGGAVSLAL